MTEKEKMLNGKWYSPEDEALKNERLRAKTLCFEYNCLKPDEIDKKQQILKELLGKMGNNIIIEAPFRCDYGYNIKVGENFFANYNLIILDTATVEFGDNVFLGPNCSFYPPEHPLDPQKRNSLIEIGKPIKIGNNVWIGGSVTVLGGVTIGDNCVIGAGSVVTKDIPPDTVATGNPCRIIKESQRVINENK
ncbi:MAG: sugar O-acetyltransferase [Candidatus Gastranaerophilales bacterium]|nr:sugar O-acetyltransferase [Candidatus Gastranaerophilales bacterium]